MALQEDYFETLVELGIHYENTGQLRQAFDLYQKGIEKAEKAKKMLEGTLVGMLD
jgi:predicted transcriptional regulator